MGIEVKLLGFVCSPGSYRVIWALKLKGVEYEYIEEDIFNKSARLLELNPVHKKVPVLIHDKKVIPESLIILEYIDENWQQDRLLPQDPYERALARFWAKFAEEKLLKSAWKAMWTKGEEKEIVVKEIIEALEKMEEQLKGKTYFGGDSIGYLDISIGWICCWLPLWEEIGSLQILDSKKFPAITEWKSKFLDHPVIKDNLPPMDNMLVYLHKRCKQYENDAVLRALARKIKLEN